MKAELTAYACMHDDDRINEQIGKTCRRAQTSKALVHCIEHAPWLHTLAHTVELALELNDIVLGLFLLLLSAKLVTCHPLNFLTPGDGGCVVLDHSQIAQLESAIPAPENVDHLNVPACGTTATASSLSEACSHTQVAANAVVWWARHLYGVLQPLYG